MSTFTDYLEKEHDGLQGRSQLSDLPVDLNVQEQYTLILLRSLMGNYDDVEDYLNIQRALTRIMELNNENIAQCLKLK